MNHDASPAGIQIQHIPGSAELPENIHPYISGSSASPDSFALKPELMTQPIDLQPEIMTDDKEHQEQKSPIKARREKKLSPQKSKFN